MSVYGAWCLAYSKHAHIGCRLRCDFSTVVRKAALECSGYRWKAQSTASQQWLRTDLYCLLLHALFFFFWRVGSPRFVKRLCLVAVNRLLAKWLFNPVQAYSALTIKMQMKTKMRYHLLPIGWAKIKSLIPCWVREGTRQQALGGE